MMDQLQEKESAQAKRMKAHIRASLERLMATHDIEDISMIMLAQEAQVNRSTLYKYYDSLMAAVGDLIAEHMGSADTKIPVLDDPDLMGSVRQTILDSLEDIKRNPMMFRLSNHYQTKVGVARHIAVLQDKTALFYNGVIDALEHQNPGMRYDRKYLIPLLGRISGTCTELWVSGGMKEPVNEIADKIMGIFQAVIKAESSIG